VPASRNRDIRPTLIAAPRQNGTASIFAAPSSLEDCHIRLARVTLLATIASATRTLGHDWKFITLISHQKLAARVINRATRNSAHAVTPGGCLADEKPERKTLIAISTSGAKG
jgi:hypothetical protein